MRKIILLIVLSVSSFVFAQKEGQDFCEGNNKGSYFPLDITKKKIYWYSTFYYEVPNGIKIKNEKQYVEFKQDALKLRKISFSGCSLVAADFMKTDLTEAVFDHCDLRRTVFIETILNKADFTTSFNYAFDPEVNKIKKAQFSLEGLQGLLQKYDIVVK